jgi:phosphoenolpyruvate synthase (EC 2.7.9.2)
MSDKSTKIILWFEELRKEDVPIVGGKNANLGELINAGIPVPPGFAVTAYAYKRFIEETGIKDKVYEILREKVPAGSAKPEDYVEASNEIRKLIESVKMPKDIEEEIRKAYRQLSQRVGKKEEFVAVRSSATAEDLPDASFAGQQETYLM